MSFETWFAFAAACLLVGIVPGPAVMSIVGYAIGSGRRTALASVAGMTVGSLTAMTLSLAGVGALLAASARAFAILKWAGALYLIGMGIITLVKSRGAIADVAAPAPIPPRTAFLSNIAMGTFHPKTLMFFIAFAPQFISATGSYVQQCAILIATFALVVGCTDTGYALIASRASHFFRRPKTALWSRRAGGGVLIAAGVATAAAHK